MITNKTLFRLGSLLFCLFIVEVGFFVQHKTTLAASYVNGYQITVTESATTMIYGDLSPTFRAQLTVPIGVSVTSPNDFYIRIDSQSYAGGGSLSGSSPTYLLYLNGTYGTPLSVGQHSVVAVYTSSNQGIIESAPIKLTVTKSALDLTCFISNLAYTYAPNTTLTITLSFSDSVSSAAVDWQKGTDTISFVGSRTFTYSNLKPNASSQITVSTPSVTDNYKLRCIFNGSPSFNSAEFDLGAVVSENKQPSIKLYTNPTTLKYGQSATWYVVVSGIAGLPIPTGEISITIGTSYTRLTGLGPDGTMTAQGIVPPLTGNTIKILYSGDPVYTWYDASFPLTNPSIPTTGGSIANPTPGNVTGGNTTQPLPTSMANAATPGSSPTSTTIAKAASISSSSSTPGATSSPTAGLIGSNVTKLSPNQGNAGGWILLGTLVALASSGVVGLVVLRRRSNTSMPMHDDNSRMR